MELPEEPILGTTVAGTAYASNDGHSGKDTLQRSFLVLVILFNSL